MDRKTHIKAFMDAIFTRHRNGGRIHSGGKTIPGHHRKRVAVPCADAVNASFREDEVAVVSALQHHV
ncbi:hypothetical protein SDC9_112167 [bioreactor metagenome]|uniref:Uncharacterized protein n=1 Tax=bioreactor metagenome TaxID=1076179 RepID=A0A645BJ24_9ZZZZ